MKHIVNMSKLSTKINAILPYMLTYSRTTGKQREAGIINYHFMKEKNKNHIDFFNHHKPLSHTLASPMQKSTENIMSDPITRLNLFMCLNRKSNIA